MITTKNKFGSFFQYDARHVAAFDDEIIELLDASLSIRVVKIHLTSDELTGGAPLVKLYWLNDAAVEQYVYESSGLGEHDVDWDHPGKKVGAGKSLRLRIVGDTARVSVHVEAFQMPG